MSVSASSRNPHKFVEDSREQSVVQESGIEIPAVRSLNANSDQLAIDQGLYQGLYLTSAICCFIVPRFQIGF